MVRRIGRGLSLLFCIAALCGSLSAQTEKTITIRVIDGKTGKPFAASGYLVRINREETVHANWAVENEDGTGKLTLPENATQLSIHVTYDSSTLTYLNCDSASEKTNPIDRWYAISEILTSGVVVPNGCIKPGATAKFKPIEAKPGELVVMVRRKTTVEQFRE
jgi:hypothetical protein